MEPQKKLLMIVNPRAGRSKPRGPLYDAAAALCDAGYLLRIRRTTAAGDAARIAAQEGGDYDTVVAVGGDGTLNEVIRHPNAENSPGGGLSASGEHQ